MPLEEENLDDIIASLIDDDTEPEEAVGLPEAPSGEVSDNPVIVTERAAKQISKIKENENLDEGLYLRVAVEGGGCSGLSYKLGFDIRTDDDRVIESQGLEIIVDPKHLIYLNGIQIDYPDGLDARGFTFDNPNASESCGCGSSFAV
ncbi:HesB/IscA family protein [Rhodohalobacter mucosus]|uniref:Iron-sulfur cluster assembly accessory protein n=1 Tax=Rhodohalobacter mucosus TaxID=2079485 RepID=A0A316TZX1_9BACT|nr:iron-sulfur cluster assembly accessory protein [Rhodohalobacter mucosus]PWN05806.1 iron-sulfur cluster assembly accessory protein [Rhodohalobacter mucosus]